MGKLLLCSGKRAERPFAFSKGHINLFSIEELCYYLYHNIYSITDDMINSNLVSFLYNQLDLKFLAGRVDAYIKTNSLLEEKVMAIMSSSNYYTEAELAEFKKKLNSIGNLSIEERLKFKGDSYLQNKKYSHAIKAYLDLLNKEDCMQIDKEIYAKTLHNLGVAYMRVFLFEEALECFQSAYAASQEEEIIKSYLKALKIAEKEEMYQEVVGEIVSEIREKWEAEWERLLLERREREEPKEEISELISKWKQEYRAQMT